MPTYEEMIEQAASGSLIPEAGFAQTQTPIQSSMSYDDMINAAAFPVQQQIAPELQPEQPEKIGFWENIKRGGWGGFFDKATLGVKELVNAKSLYDAVDRHLRDEYSNDSRAQARKAEDKQQIIDYLEEQAELSERGKTVAAKVGDIVGDMLPFMAEFIATGGVAALGKKAVTKGVLKLITKTVGKAATKTAGRLAVRNAAVRGAGWVTSAGIRTALTPHRSLKDFIDRRMPDIEVSPEGQLIFEEAKDSPFKSAYKAIGNQFIEMASEEAGAFLGVLGGKVASKVLPKKAVTAFAKLKDAWVAGGTGRTAKQFATKMATKAGFNGILEEYSEERLGGLMRAVTGIDEGEGSTFEKIQRALFPDKEQAFVELIAFAVPGVARAGVAQAFEAKPDKTTYSRRDILKMFDNNVNVQTDKATRKALFDAHKAMQSGKFTEESAMAREAYIREQIAAGQPIVEADTPELIEAQETPEISEIDVPAEIPQVKEDIETANVVPSDITETEVGKPEAVDEAPKEKVKAYRGGTKGQQPTVKTASDTAQFGSGVYFGPLGVAEDFATERPDGEVQEYEIDTSNFFDERTADLDTPEGRKVADALIEAGAGKEFVEANFGGVGSLSFIGKAFQKKGEFGFAGSAEIKKAVQDAGFDGVISEYQGAEQYAAYEDKAFAQPSQKLAEPKKPSKGVVKSQIPSVQDDKIADVPSVQTVPEPVKKPVPKVDKAKKPAEVESTSVIARQMQETLRSHGESLNLGYTPISIQEETDAAIQFVKEKPEEAKRIAYASETGDNLKSNAVRLAYAESVKESGDMVEYARIANQIVSKNRELGQAIVVNRGFTGSPIEYVKQVVAAKINQAGKKLAGVGTKKSSQKKVSDRMKSEVDAVKKAVESKKMSNKDVSNLLDKWECP